jgi:hypothetical protein
VGIGLAIAAVVLILATRGRGGGQVAWASLQTQDVHSLAFVVGDPEHVLFGHHGGLLESRDGGSHVVRAARPRRRDGDRVRF